MRGLGLQLPQPLKPRLSCGGISPLTGDGDRRNIAQQVDGGIIMFMTRHKTQTPMGVIIGLILGGILLLSIMTFASSGSSTVFGYDATTSAQAALGN